MKTATIILLAVLLFLVVGCAGTTEDRSSPYQGKWSFALGDPQTRGGGDMPFIETNVSIDFSGKIKNEAGDWKIDGTIKDSGKIDLTIAPNSRGGFDLLNLDGTLAPAGNKLTGTVTTELGQHSLILTRSGMEL